MVEKSRLIEDWRPAGDSAAEIAAAKQRIDAELRELQGELAARAAARDAMLLQVRHTELVAFDAAAVELAAWIEQLARLSELLAVEAARATRRERYAQLLADRDSYNVRATAFAERFRAEYEPAARIVGGLCHEWAALETEATRLRLELRHEPDFADDVELGRRLAVAALALDDPRWSPNGSMRPENVVLPAVRPGAAPFWDGRARPAPDGFEPRRAGLPAMPTRVPAELREAPE